MLLLGLAAAGVAVARPQVETTVADKHSVVVMLVDVSGSMEATDVRPSRIVAAANAMRGFVSRLPPQADVGLVEFSTEPQVIALPTTDHERILDSLEYLAPNGATAIGDGLTTAIAVIKQSGVGREWRSARSDRASLRRGAGSGTVLPAKAAARAKAAGVPVYTIAFGTPGGKVSFEGFPYPVPVPPDPQTMDMIAKVTGGRTFTAQTASQATSVYKGLGTSLAREHKEQVLTAWFALAAAIIFAGAALLSRIVGPAL